MTEEKKEIETVSEKEDKPWYQVAKEAPIASGNYLTIGSGFEYILSFDEVLDPRNDEKVMRKGMNAKEDDPLKPKYWFYVRLHAVKGKKSTIDTLIEQELITEEKANKIKGLDKNKEYLLQLPPTGRKALGKFIGEANLQDGQSFKMTRTGSQAKTRYNFNLLVEKN